MSNTSFNFKDNLTIDNNKYLKWLDTQGISRGNIIAVTSSNNVSLNSAFGGEVHINNDANSLTVINDNNANPVLVASQLGIGMNTTSDINTTVCLPSNGSIGLNSTSGSLKFIAGSSSGSQMVMYANSGISGGSIDIYAGSMSTGNISFFTGNNSMKARITNDGSVSFSPNGSITRLSITDVQSTVTNNLVLASTEESTGSSTGALQVAGGISVRGNCFVDGTLSINSVTGNINFDSSQASTSSTTGAIYLSGGLGISNTTNATSVTSGGGFTIAGGGSIAKSLFVGGTVTLSNTTLPTSAETGALVVSGGIGMGGPFYLRSNSSSQINLAPVSNQNETSISFFANNTFDQSTTGGSTNWTLGQNVNSIQSGTFIVSNSQVGVVTCIQPSGNIGIGTTSASCVLDINGGQHDVRLAGFNPSFLIQSNNTSGGTLTLGISSTSGAYVSSSLDNDAIIKSSHSLIFASNGGTISNVIISTNGNVGINTSSPNSNLDVNGNVRVSNQLFLTSTAPSQGVGSGGALVVNGGASFASNMYVGDTCFFEKTVYITSTQDATATSGSLLLNGGVNILCTTDTLGSTNGGSLFVQGGASISKGLSIGGPICKIPTGTTLERPNTPIQGLIRYNTETSQFEGYGAGNWGSLGGVIDVSQNTKILAELFPGANDGNLRFFTDGIERMRINSSGNIGIATTSPGYLFDINGSLNASALTAIHTTISNLYTPLGTITSLLITSATATNVSVSQGHFISTFSTSLNSTNASFSTITSNNLLATGLSVFSGSIQGTNQTNTLGNIYTYNGNVGVSITTPSYNLDVNGSTHISGDLIVDGSISGSGSSSSTMANLTLTSTNEAINLTTGALVTYGGISVQATATASSETQGGALLIAGGASITKNLIVGTTLQSDRITIKSTSNASGVGTGGALTVLGGASFDKDVYVGGTLTSASDARLKCNIKTLDKMDVLNKLCEINPVKYNFTTDQPNQSQQYGFIAQEFTKHFPELVKQPHPSGYYSLDYMKVTVLLLQCVKDLKQQLDQLKNN